MVVEGGDNVWCATIQGMFEHELLVFLVVLSIFSVVAIIRIPNIKNAPGLKKFILFACISALPLVRPLFLYFDIGNNTPDRNIQRVMNPTIFDQVTGMVELLGFFLVPLWIIYGVRSLIEGFKQRKNKQLSDYYFVKFIFMLVVTVLYLYLMSSFMIVD